MCSFFKSVAERQAVPRNKPPGVQYRRLEPYTKWKKFIKIKIKKKYGEVLAAIYIEILWATFARLTHNPLYSRGRVALGHPHRVVIAGPISGQSDGGKWRDAICYTVEIMWLCNDPLLIDKQCGALSCFVAYMIINDVALDEIAIRQRDCYSIWVSAARVLKVYHIILPYLSCRDVGEMDCLF